MRHALAIAGISLAFWLDVCGASSIPSLSPAAATFERECISTRGNCAYKRIRYESTHSVVHENHIYRMLKSKHDFDEYNQVVASLQVAMRGLESISVQRYVADSKTWLSLNGTKKCKYCVDVNRFDPMHPAFLRINVVQDLTVASNEFLAYTSFVYKGQNEKDRIIISSPSLVHANDHSTIYIDSRIKGLHATTSFNEGGITIDLDAMNVPAYLPDYVVVSPLKSWAVIATDYRQREVALLKNATGLQGYADGTLEERLDRVARRLRGYRIRYDGVSGGFFPSVDPDSIIASRHGDCKAIATLMEALLERSGIRASDIVLSASGRPPLSFSVPDALWSPLHVILYLSDLGLYVDPVAIASFNTDWRTSGNAYRGAIALDMTTGTFIVVP